MPRGGGKKRLHDEEWISRRITGLLRYDLCHICDAEGFTPLGDVVRQCRELQSYNTEFITWAIENSSGDHDHAPRFELRKERDILFVKVRHQEPSHVRKPREKNHGESRAASGSQNIGRSVERTTGRTMGRSVDPRGEPWGESYSDSDSNSECDAHDCRASALGCRSQLLSFLIQAFAWLSPQEHVPSTACLQTFVESSGWKTFVPLGPPRERCSSADLDRSWCLQLIEWQIFRLNAAELVENQLHADARRNSCTVQDYLRDLWQLNRYDSSWQMSWQHLLRLFTKLLDRP